MKIPENIVDKLLQEKDFSRFDKTFQFENETYHYFVNDSIFFSQMCRVYSLLAKELGVSSAEYDYIRKGKKNLLFSKSICDLEEKLIEWGNIDYAFLEREKIMNYEDYINAWLQVINFLPFKDRNKTLNEFYKQWFFALLIFDDDKQISIVKDSKGLYRLGEYFDYGGIYFSQDSNHIDNDIFYDEEEFNDFCSDEDRETPYTKDNLKRDLDWAIERSVLNDIEWREGYDEALNKILPNINLDFVAKCFSVNILDVINKDIEHEYSENFKKVISCMFETSRSLLKNKIENLQLMQSAEEVKKI